MRHLVGVDNEYKSPVSRWAVKAVCLAPRKNAGQLPVAQRPGSDSRRLTRNHWRSRIQGRETEVLFNRTGRPDHITPQSRHGGAGQGRKRPRENPQNGLLVCAFTALELKTFGLPPIPTRGSGVDRLPWRTKCGWPSNQRRRKQLLGVPHARSRGPWGGRSFDLLPSCWRQRRSNWA